MSSAMQEARARERTRVMRDVSAIAVRLFAERGYGNVRMEDVAEASGVSVATLYRRFTTKENLVCWQADEQGGMAMLLAAVRSGRRISDAAMELARTLPDEAPAPGRQGVALSPSSRREPDPTLCRPGGSGRPERAHRRR
ncbi:helix-turn-helix domain-containing protein [Nocardioides sp. NPDC006273]|uniref:helix-turn-helix domain-containing protein n=1 Tax=Nocardioides sp. NPDC006273 TaxID=3155598 RepID=UPI0033B6D064